MSTQVVKTPQEWAQIKQTLQGKSIGFVPTMGALHEGHLSLIKKSKNENDITIASIFVNPTQFNDPKDLEKYPRTFEHDLELLNSEKCDYVFYPKFEDLYKDNYKYKVTENIDSQILCGAHRPGHFNGVLTIVLKLLNIIEAQNAYFGEKDYQQLHLIQGMAENFFLPTKIIGCPTVREHSGLALSSRNALLTSEEKQKALELSKALQTKKSPQDIKSDLEAKGFKVDYIEDHWGRRFGAIHLGNVRLIDNVEL